eukprot:2369295-Alexandrium_andersonii.AAC.1
MAQTIGFPQGCDLFVQEPSSLSAPWRSTVVGDSMLSFIERKSGPEYPTCKYLSPIALEASQNEPSIFVESGRRFEKVDMVRQRCVRGRGDGC